MGNATRTSTVSNTTRITLQTVIPRSRIRTLILPVGPARLTCQPPTCLSCQTTTWSCEKPDIYGIRYRYPSCVSIPSSPSPMCPILSTCRQGVGAFIIQIAFHWRWGRIHTLDSPPLPRLPCTCVYYLQFYCLFFLLGQKGKDWTCDAFFVEYVSCGIRF